MPTDYEIRDRIAAYLMGDISLDEFQQWLIPIAWDALQGEAAAVPQALELLGDVELTLAEYTNGHLPEDELRARLQVLLQTYRIGVPPSLTGSDATTESSEYSIGLAVRFSPSVVAGTQS